jgi:hypothetical protein
MYFKESLRIALHCMRAGRLRTILTILGIVVSVAVVITSSGLNTGLVNSYRDAGDANYAAIFDHGLELVADRWRQSASESPRFRYSGSDEIRGSGRYLGRCTCGEWYGDGTLR